MGGLPLDSLKTFAAGYDHVIASTYIENIRGAVVERSELNRLLRDAKNPADAGPLRHLISDASVTSLVPELQRVKAAGMQNLLPNHHCANNNQLRLRPVMHWCILRATAGLVMRTVFVCIGLTS
ncbi:hypothetical protein D3C73_1304490 [compost metagenome]